MSTIHDLNTRNFLRNLAKQDNSYFVTPWAGVIVRNSDTNGQLIQHSTIQSYIKSKTAYWIYLKLKIFRDEEGIYGAFICPTCQSMSTVMMMSMDQRRGDIENTLCILWQQHSTQIGEKFGVYPILMMRYFLINFSPD